MERREGFKALFWHREESRLRAPIRIFLQFIVFLLFMVIMIELSNRFIAPRIRSVGITHAFSIGLTFIPYLFAVYVGTRFLDKRPFNNIGLQIGRGWMRQYVLGLVIGSLLISGTFLFKLAFGWVEIQGTLFNASTIHILILLPLFFTVVALVFVAQFANAAYLVKNTAEGLSGYVSVQSAIAGAIILRLVVAIFLFSGNPGATAYAILVETLLQLIVLIAYVYTGKIAFPAGFATGWTVFILYIYNGRAAGFNAPTSVFDVEYVGPPAITGGEFGVDGGLAALFAVVVGIFIIFGWLRLTGKMNIPAVVYSYQPIKKK